MTHKSEEQSLLPQNREGEIKLKNTELLYIHKGHHLKLLYYKIYSQTKVVFSKAESKGKIKRDVDVRKTLNLPLSFSLLVL